VINTDCQVCKDGTAPNHYFLHTPDKNCYIKGDASIPAKFGPDLTTTSGSRVTAAC
jgi:hypothetical protein